MSQAAGSRAPIPVTQSLKSELLTLFMYAWFGVILAVTAYAAIKPEFGKAEPKLVSVLPTKWSGIVSDIERHCIIATTIAEATPHSRVEVIEIARTILLRRTMEKWGSTACAVVTAPKQFSSWNDRMLPGVPVTPNAQYLRYAAWVEEAIDAGPNEWSHFIHPDTMVLLYGYRYPRWWTDCVETKKIGAAEFCTMRRMG